MSTTDDVRAATLAIVNSYQRLLLQQRWDEWIELWTDDAELEFPYAPSGRQSTYRGKLEILAYMRATPGRVAIDTVRDMKVFPMLDPTVAVVEVAIDGHIPATNAPYDQRYVLFFEAQDGKLRRYLEYWNPLVSIDAMGGRDVWARDFVSIATGTST
jgi:uncharacterized protein